MDAPTIMYLYILNDPDKPTVTKVGITKNPSQRLRTYRVAAPHATFLETYSIDSKHHEKAVIDLLRDIFTVRNEVIYTSPQRVKVIVEGYLTDNFLL